MNEPLSVTELAEILSRQKGCFEVYIYLEGGLGYLVDVRVDEQAQTVTLWGGGIA